MPVLLVETGTYQTVVDVNHLASAIPPKSYRKIETARILFEEHVDVDALRSAIEAVADDALRGRLTAGTEKLRAERSWQNVVEGYAGLLRS